MDISKSDLEIFKKFYSGSDNIFFSIQGESLDSFVSDSVEKLTGYTPSEIINLPQLHHSLICDEDLELNRKVLAEFEKKPNKNSLELIYRINTKDSQQIWIKEFLNVERSQIDDSIISSKSLVLDITEIKQNETELQKSRDALKDLNTQKDKFINIISHDLRSPFTTLLGFSEILLNEPDIAEEEKSEYLHYIYDASKNQLQMINCLLDWSRLQTGRIKVEPVRLNVKTVVSNAITPLTGDAVRKNIDVRIDIPNELNINADERLISQAIINLASNAIKFTPEGKEVYISSSRFREGMVEIVVRDEGLGIAEENQSKLFKIDQKFSLVGTSGEKGSGLGLTLVKEIIEKHGGQVWFYSQIGEGSEFHLTVPEAKNLVLLVEDDQAIRMLYKKIIEHALPNFDVKFADNGYQAISLYRSLIPTIVITDHDMPLMNGIQLVEAIQKKESNKTVPIVVISAKLDEEITKKYLRLGVDKVIKKPIDHDNLVQVIRDCLY
jgi:two-component system, sensor histidine kinase and response regulator